MHLLRRVSSLTLRHIVILIILLVILLNTAQGTDNRRHWVYDLFKSSTSVQIFEDGSGIAAGPEGETIRFCIDDKPCADRADHADHADRLRADTPHRQTSGQIRTAAGRRTN